MRGKVCEKERKRERERERKKNVIKVSKAVQNTNACSDAQTLFVC